MSELDIEYWLEEVNKRVSFTVKNVRKYNREFYLTCIQSIRSNVAGFNLNSFMRGTMERSVYERILWEMHERLSDNYKRYKSSLRREGIMSKAICPERDDWYTLDYDCLPEEIKEQYLEIMQSIMSVMIDVSLTTLVNSMAISE